MFDVRLALRVVVAIAAVYAATMAGAQTAKTPPPTVIVDRGDVFAVAQTPRTVVWCGGRSQRTFGLHTTAIATGSDQVIPATWCGSDIALASGRVAIAGYEEERCGEMTSMVTTVVGRRWRAVAGFVGGCARDGVVYQGIASDGTNLYYAVLKVRMSSGQFGEFRYRLAGGGIYRIVGARGVRAPGLRLAAVVAAAEGLIVLARPQQQAPEPLPRAVPNGQVEVRRSRDASLVATFRPRGVVRRLALSQEYAVAVVQASDGEHIEWFAARTGARGGDVRAGGDASALSASGHLAVFVEEGSEGTSTLWLLDLRSGRKTLLTRVHGDLISPSVLGTRVVWGERDMVKGSRVLALEVAPG